MRRWPPLAASQSSACKHTSCSRKGPRLPASSHPAGPAPQSRARACRRTLRISRRPTCLAPIRSTHRNRLGQRTRPSATAPQRLPPDGAAPPLSSTSAPRPDHTSVAAKAFPTRRWHAVHQTTTSPTASSVSRVRSCSAGTPSFGGSSSVIWNSRCPSGSVPTAASHSGRTATPGVGGARRPCVCIHGGMYPWCDEVCFNLQALEERGAEAFISQIRRSPTFRFPRHLPRIQLEFWLPPRPAP